MNENNNIDVNKKNKDEYDFIINNMKKKELDNYYDINNPTIKIILIAMLIFIIAGSIIFFINVLGKVK